MPPAVLEQDKRPRIRLWPALPHPGQNSLAESFNLFEALVFHFWNGNIIIVINFIVIIASDGCEDDFYNCPGSTHMRYRCDKNARAGPAAARGRPGLHWALMHSELLLQACRMSLCEVDVAAITPLYK